MGILGFYHLGNSVVLLNRNFFLGILFLLLKWDYLGFHKRWHYSIVETFFFFKIIMIEGNKKRKEREKKEKKY